MIKTEMQKIYDAMFKKYRIRWDFITELCASVPADPELRQKWLDSRKPRVKPPGGKSIDEINEEVLATLAEPEEELGSLLVFQRDKGVLVVRAGTIKAHIKDKARRVSSYLVGKIEGERSFATRVINTVYPDPSQYWVPILRQDGTPVTEADGERDKAIHVVDAKGRPVNAIKRFEYLNGARIEFDLLVVGGQVPESDLLKLFLYGGLAGYGGERGDGEGKYAFELNQLERSKEDDKERRDENAQVRPKNRPRSERGSGVHIQ